MIPLIPIALAVAGLTSGVVPGITSMRNAKAEAKAIQKQATAQINERAKQARLLMSKQKTSFLKGGVYFDSGTPNEVINETYDTMQSDISDIAKDSDTKASNYIRQGKTAFFTSLIDGIVKGAMGYAGADKMLGSGGTEKILSSISNSKLGTNVQNWYNSKRGWTIGGFGTASGGSSTTKIA